MAAPSCPPTLPSHGYVLPDNSGLQQSRAACQPHVCPHPSRQKQDARSWGRSRPSATTAAGLQGPGEKADTTPEGQVISALYANTRPAAATTSVRAAVNPSNPSTVSRWEARRKCAPVTHNCSSQMGPVTNQKSHHSSETASEVPASLSGRDSPGLSANYPGNVCTHLRLHNSVPYWHCLGKLQPSRCSGRATPFSLTDGSWEAVVPGRLSVIPSPVWRNIFLPDAGGVFFPQGQEKRLLKRLSFFTLLLSRRAAEKLPQQLP